MRCIRSALLAYSVWMVVVTVLLFRGEDLFPRDSSSFWGPKTLLVAYQFNLFVMAEFLLMGRLRGSNT